MTYETLEIDIAGPVGTIWMNRPDQHNAFNEVLIAELTDAVTRLSGQDDVRLIVLGGRGPSFSAGADLGWMKRQGEASEADNLADAVTMGRMFMAVRHCPKPMIARIQGAAIGGGMGLVAACDIAIATPEAVFATTEVRLGLIPAVISPLVAAAIGERQCRRYFLTGERISAGDAKAIGLVHVVAEDGLDAAVARVTADLLKGAPEAQREAKALIDRVSGRGFTDDVVSETAGLIAARRASTEAKDGLSAFLDKRKPGWIVGG